MRKIFIGTIFFFLCSTFAGAQAMTSYLFLEVVDSSQKPVSDAKVETTLRSPQIISQTDADGKFRIEFLDMGRPPFLSQFTVTRSGYYPFYDFGTLRGGGGRQIKIELLKMPRSKKERRMLGNEQLKRDFFSALQKGDIQTVGKLLKSGLSPNLSIGDLRGVSGFENIPAIMFPTLFADGAMIKLLLDEGADVRKKDYFLSNILSYYLQSGPLERNNPKTEQEKAKILLEYDAGLKALIKAGAAVNSDKDGESSLIRAIETGKVNAVKILIASGANVNAKAYSGETILSFAREYQKYNKDRGEYQEIIELLEAAGAKD